MKFLQKSPAKNKLLIFVRLAGRDFPASHLINEKLTPGIAVDLQQVFFYFVVLEVNKSAKLI
jgi:hypothetical protein